KGTLSDISRLEKENASLKATNSDIEEQIAIIDESSGLPRLAHPIIWVSSDEHESVVRENNFAQAQIDDFIKI
uniref:hypothetical protein n=1 Tax=Salmonella enterica TaxID=28901 RepID=UPI00329876ED